MSEFGKIQGIEDTFPATSTAHLLPVKEVPSKKTKQKTRTKLHGLPRRIQAINIKLDPKLIDPEVHHISIEGTIIYLEVEYSEPLEGIVK